MAAAMRTEHVQQTPRGWRVRTVKPGPHSQHEVRIAFPPGPRKKGSGKVVEILHPADEKKNPSCEVSKKAKSNPGELLIFGNPSTYVYFTLNGRQYRTDGQIVEGKDGQTWNRTGSLPVVLAARKEWAARAGNPKAFAGWKHFTTKEKNFLRSIHAPAPKNEDEVRAYKQTLQKIDEINAQYRKANPRRLSVPEQHQLKIAIATLRMSDAMVGVMGGPNKEQAREIIRRLTAKKQNPRRRRKARKNPDETKQAVKLF